MIGSKQREKITFNREFLFRNFHAEKSRHGTDKKKRQDQRETCLLMVMSNFVYR